MVSWMIPLHSILGEKRMEILFGLLCVFGYVMVGILMTKLFIATSGWTGIYDDITEDTEIAWIVTFWPIFAVFWVVAIAGLPLLALIRKIF